MKKLIASILLVAMLLTLFAGCNTQSSTPDTSAAPTAGAPDENLADAVAYVKTLYKNAAEMTSADYQRIGNVPMGETKYEVVWTVDVSEDLVKIVKGEDGLVTIDVNEESEEEVAYVLTATLTGTDGVTESLTWNHILPAAVGDDPGAILELAYALEDGQSLPNEATLTGVITAIDDPWSEKYGNITVIMQIPGYEDYPIMCYRLAGDGAKDLAVGDTITVTGILKNYKGTIEFDQGCNLDSVTKGDGTVAGVPTDPAEIIAAAFELEKGESLPYTATLTGPITWINSGYSAKYNNISVSITVEGKRIQCFRLTGEGVENLNLHDVITVTGVITNYYGTIEFDQGCTFELVSEGTPPTEPEDDQTLVDYAYMLTPGEYLTYTATMTGTITSIDYKWSDEYQNITVTMVVPGREDMPIKCYRLKGEGAKDLRVGDTITVQGAITNYKDKKTGEETIEFTSGCQLIAVTKAPTVAVPTDPVQIVKDAYALAADAGLPYNPVTLTGTVTSVDDAYSATYKNVTVTMVVAGAESMPIKCYRISGTGADVIGVGDTITVSGDIINYKGNTVEFNYGTLVSYTKNTSTEETEPEENKPTTPAEIVAAAYALGVGEKLPGTYTLSGNITSIDTAYNSEYGNITVTMLVEGKAIKCFRMKGTGVDMIAVGDTITVTGTLMNYNGTVEFDAGCSLDSYVDNTVEPADITAAKALENGQKLSTQSTLTGTVISVNSIYSSGNDNVTVTVDFSGTYIQCYRMGCNGNASVWETDTVTVTGTLGKDKYGNIQFYNSSLTDYSQGSVAKPVQSTDFNEIYAQASAMNSGSCLPYYVTLTGVISEIDTAYSEEYKNISVWIIVDGNTDKPVLCYRLKGDAASTLKEGDTITVNGMITKYGNTIEFASGCKLQ